MDELLEGIGTADIVDAMGRTHRHRCHLIDLVSPAPERVLFGPAVTISYFPACDERMHPDEYDFARFFYEAVEEGAAGKVLVLASNGLTEASLGGGTKLSRVHNHHMAGVLAEGRLRDFEELARYDFATYCRGETTRWGGDALRPYRANEPVVVSGVGIVPGDYVYADVSGAVVVPGDEIEAILEEASRIAEEDARFIDQIAGEDPSTAGGER
jgi:4-hydroxy-4-methyl-2-oxoglutarate aldolase